MSDSTERREAAERARRRARVFGEVLPEVTGDERSPDRDDANDPGGSTAPRRDEREEWLRDNVPPHHGG